MIISDYFNLLHKQNIKQLDNKRQFNIFRITVHSILEPKYTACFVSNIDAEQLKWIEKQSFEAVVGLFFLSNYAWRNLS